MKGILDTYSQFLRYWDAYGSRPVEEQVTGWAEEYMSEWPELLEKQKRDYADSSLDWRSIAAERIMPKLEERLEAMARARALLSGIIGEMHTAAEDRFGMERLEILYVIYVGIGGGAGWVTGLMGSQAVLLGLEMIAECGWTEPDSLRPLLAHEVGHAIHGILRDDPELNGGSGPFWQLYTEGFAQRCEHMIMDRPSWNVSRGVNDDDWLEWCDDNRVWLAGRFLQAAEQGDDIRPFFGSWFELQGRKHCGYYLGHEAVLRLERSSDLKTIAILEDVDGTVTNVLKEMITGG